MIPVKHIVEVKRPVMVRPECVDLAGDFVVGALLSQIVYWYLPNSEGRSKLRVKRDGVYWVAKTREDWMRETCLTLDQYKRAIKVLKQKGLIEIRMMKFGGDTMSHLRLLQSIAGAVVFEPPTGWCKTHHPAGVLSTTVNTEITTETTDISGDGKTIAGTAETKDGGKNAGGTGEEQNTVGVEEKIVVMKATEILKVHQGKVTQTLGTLWKSRMALLDDEYQKPLTGKQQGQLKYLSKTLGDDRARQVINYVLSNWWKFASRAGASAGTSFPADPNIGFLVTHHDVAVNLLVEKTASPPPKAGPKPVQSIAAGAEEEPVKTLTPQELAELIDGLKSP